MSIAAAGASSSESGHSSNTGGIVGGVLGGFLSIACGLVFVYKFKRGRPQLVPVSLGTSVSGIAELIKEDRLRRTITVQEVAGPERNVGDVETGGRLQSPVEENTTSGRLGKDL
jgi:hypothetical protein